MGAYLFWRIIRWITGLAIVLFVVYAMMYYGGGDPIKRMFLESDQAAQIQDSKVEELLREKYGLDQPFIVQFRNYVVNLFQGDWGRSIRLDQDRQVWDMVKARMPISMQMGLAATVLIALVGIPLGILASLYHNRWLDRVIVGSVTFVNAIPIFVTGPMLIYFFVLVLGVMDVPYGWHGLFSTKTILPLVVIVLAPLPIVIRQTRAAMLEVMSNDYVRTAHAKGLPERIVIFRHMFRVVMTPVVTSLGLIMITLVNGSLFVELIFGIPGFGLLTVQGIQLVDYPIIMAVTIIGTLIIFVSNFLVDIVYPLLDPRVTHK